MSDQDATTQDDAQTDVEPQNDDASSLETDDGSDGSADLGDAGKRAIDAMKAKWHGERDKRKALESRIAELEAAASPKQDDDKPDVDAIKREAQTAATKAANERILKAEVKAAAAGKLADPADALRFIDLSSFEVDEDGNVDADEIAEAIDNLAKNKPYLSAQGGKRFQGSADNGARKDAAGPKQLTRDDLKNMSSDAIVKAKKEGRFNDLLGIK